jgi:hypothetical protein
MNPARKIFYLLLAIACATFSCSDEVPSGDSAELIIGRWNSYEFGTQQMGFIHEITASLTAMYESGITFSSDGTFRPRHHHNGTWTEGNAGVGTYELKDKIITLVFSPGTNDEHTLDIQFVRLDEKYLWFKHSLFVETEYHLKRVE